jgi:hypothetical protein
LDLLFTPILLEKEEKSIYYKGTLDLAEISQLATGASLKKETPCISVPFSQFIKVNEFKHYLQLGGEDN